VRGRSNPNVGGDTIIGGTDPPIASCFWSSTDGSLNLNRSIIWPVKAVLPLFFTLLPQYEKFSVEVQHLLSLFFRACPEMGSLRASQPVSKSFRFLKHAHWGGGRLWKLPIGRQPAKNEVSGQPLSWTFVIFRNSLICRNLEPIPYWGIRSPNGKNLQKVMACLDWQVPKSGKSRASRLSQTAGPLVRSSRGERFQGPEKSNPACTRLILA